MLVGNPFLRIRALIFPKNPSPCPVFTNSNRLRNSADKRSLTSPSATATTNGRVLLQLGEVRPAAIISSITSSGTGVGRKSRVDLREAAKVLKCPASNSPPIILLNGVVISYVVLLRHSVPTYRPIITATSQSNRGTRGNHLPYPLTQAAASILATSLEVTRASIPLSDSLQLGRLASVAASTSSPLRNSLR